jgi:predicted metal-dependent hydrolase
MPTFKTGGHTIPYEIVRRPRRRQPAIQIDRDGRVRVLLPPGFPEARVLPLLQAHEGWLVRHVLERRSIPHAFAEGEPFLYLGESLQLQLLPGERASVERRGGLLVVAGAVDATGVREALCRWYAEEALRDLTARVSRLAPVVGHWPAQLRVREYQSRWGYCRSDGLVAFNWRLLQAPPDVVDYVVVHELVHLRHPHHQPPFWEMVAAVAGDVRLSRRWLRDHDRQLHW